MKLPTNVEGWISTGTAMLDVIISNRPYGGLPVGRITEITGLEQSGKSLLSSPSWLKHKNKMVLKLFLLILKLQ